MKYSKGCPSEIHLPRPRKASYQYASPCTCRVVGYAIVLAFARLLFFMYVITPLDMIFNQCAVGMSSSSPAAKVKFGTFIHKNNWQLLT